MPSSDQGAYQRILSDAGAIMCGHFVLKSHDHSNLYINKDGLYLFPKKIVLLCRMVAEVFNKSKIRIDLVIGPEKGAIVLAHQVALQLGMMQDREVLSAYAEKKDGSFEIKRGFDAAIKGKNVLVVEDIVTTGGTIESVIEAVRNCGGRPQYVAALVNRGKVSKDDFRGVRLFHAAINVEAISWNEADCPLCAKNEPINTDVGHGAKYLADLKKSNLPTVSPMTRPF